MKSLHAFAAVLVLATAALPSQAADSADHDQHHPGSSTANTAPAKSTKPADGRIAKMDSQMMAMQDMHDKMMAAKTPEERNVLMADHMKTMQTSMMMMNDMMGAKTGGKQTPSPQMMQKQMDMMRMMMQMMMDQMPQQTPAKRP